MHTTYTVQQGDTLWEISRQYSVPLESILRENNLSNANDLTVGQVLLIPTAAAPYWYVVRRGDSLWSIANKFFTTTDELLKLNEIDNPNVIFPGQLLMIR